MLYVNSVISRKDIMDLETYMKWYDEDHIAEIMETSGIKSAFRYINTNEGASKPYLAFYPMPDIAFTQGDEFKKIRVKSDLLPGTGICYDLADIDVRYYGLSDKVGIRKGVATCLFVTAIEPDSATSNEAIEDWFKTNLQDTVSKIAGFQRTTRYSLLYARTNAQSRALKGLPTTDEPAPEPPTWMAIHEFDRVVEASEVDGVKEMEVVKKVLGKAKQVEFETYKLAKAHGSKKFFD